MRLISIRVQLIHKMSYRLHVLVPKRASKVNCFIFILALPKSQRLIL